MLNSVEHEKCFTTSGPVTLSNTLNVSVKIHLYCLGGLTVKTHLYCLAGFSVKTHLDCLAVQTGFYSDVHGRVVDCHASGPYSSSGLSICFYALKEKLIKLINT